ncbi:hypothetical protein Tco_1102133 [Tanacetum coccineum]
MDVVIACQLGDNFNKILDTPTHLTKSITVLPDGGVTQKVEAGDDRGNVDSRNNLMRAVIVEKYGITQDVHDNLKDWVSS